MRYEIRVKGKWVIRSNVDPKTNGERFGVSWNTWKRNIARVHNCKEEDIEIYDGGNDGHSNNN